MKNKENIEQAIEILVTEGRKSFVEDVNVGHAECIGMALASAIQNKDTILEIGATALEDWNHHIETEMLRKIRDGDFRYSNNDKHVLIKLHNIYK